MPKSSSVGQISLQIHDLIDFVLYCVEDMNRLSFPGSVVGRALTETTEFGWFESPPSVALLSLEKNGCPGCS